uniref:Ig-like domain-containing protein n=1 Tax=Oreochromis aureus TaxID=47969 RepID=A0AAZ1XMU0_OREAU
MQAIYHFTIVNEVWDYRKMDISGFFSFLLVQDEKEVEVGEDASLDCQGPHEGNILRLAWTKSDLKADDYVFFFREDRLYKTYQHELFKGRVELEDPNMKSGKMSIILHNITVNDAGTYECHISYETDHSQRSEMKQETKLKVTPAVCPLYQIRSSCFHPVYYKISTSNNAKICASIHFPPVLLLLCEAQLSRQTAL